MHSHNLGLNVKGGIGIETKYKGTKSRGRTVGVSMFYLREHKKYSFKFFSFLLINQ
jgi:hypothetical protein